MVCKVNYSINFLRISVQNKGEPTRGTIRIFMLPVQDLSHEKYSLEEARLLAIELDRFAIDCMLQIYKSFSFIKQA